MAVKQTALFYISIFKSTFADFYSIFDENNNANRNSFRHTLHVGCMPYVERYAAIYHFGGISLTERFVIAQFYPDRAYHTRLSVIFIHIPACSGAYHR